MPLPRTGREWSDEDVEFALDPPAGMSLREAAAALGRSYSAIVACRDKARRGWRPSTPAKPRAGVGIQRWTDEEMGLVLTPPLGWRMSRVADELGRSLQSVRRMRSRLLSGWAPTGRASRIDDARLEFIRENPGMTAVNVAEQLGTTAASVEHYRMLLRRAEGQDFGRGPYDKNPHMVRAGQLILAKTCVECGVLRGGAEFHRRSVRKVTSVCRFCTATAHDSEKAAATHAALEAVVRDLAGSYGVPYRSRGGESYTQDDMVILRDPELPISEKAARLGRTYTGTVQALALYGFSVSRPERPEPGGIWVIDRLCPDVSAVSEPCS